jgi:hypothetical protein
VRFNATVHFQGQLSDDGDGGGASGLFDAWAWLEYGPERTDTGPPFFGGGAGDGDGELAPHTRRMLGAVVQLYATWICITTESSFRACHAPTRDGRHVTTLSASPSRVSRWCAWLCCHLVVPDRHDKELFCRGGGGAAGMDHSIVCSTARAAVCRHQLLGDHGPASARPLPHRLCRTAGRHQRSPRLHSTGTNRLGGQPDECV